MSGTMDDTEPGLDRPLILAPAFSGAKFREVVQFPVIVAAWDHKYYGRGKREWLKTFDEKERATIARWHTSFRKWHLVTGIPDRVMCRLNTITLLQRACNFFATL